MLDVWTLHRHELAAAAAASCLEDGVAFVAAERDWVLSTRQLAALGVDRNRVLRWCRRRLLTHLGRGVYLFGPGHPTQRGAIRAALLGAGRSSSVACRSAGVVFDVRAYNGRFVDLTAPGRSRRYDTTYGTVNIIGRRLHPDDLTVVDGLPVTSIGLTMIDIAAQSPNAVNAMLRRAEEVRVFDLFSVDDAIERRPRRAGVAELFAGLRRLHPLAGDTRSLAELANIMMLEGAGVEMPRVNVTVDGYELDTHWPELMLNIEIDGPHHERASQRAADRLRDADLEARGWRVRRFTTRDLRERPLWVLAETLAELARARARIGCAA